VSNVANHKPQSQYLLTVINYIFDLWYLIFDIFNPPLDLFYRGLAFLHSN